MKVCGLPVFGILAASVAFYFIGFLWYGMLFSDLWMTEMGLSEADFEDSSPLWMLVGVVITIGQVKGIAFVLKWMGWPEMGRAVASIALLAFLFAVCIAGYDLAYSATHSVSLFLIDGSHLLAGWIVSAVILTLMK